MRAVDTKVLVRLVTRDDPRQLAAAERFVESGAWASILAIAETSWVLTEVYNLTSTELAIAIEMLLNQRALAIQHRDAVAAALETFRAKPSLGFSDCLMLALARSEGYLPLGTFDRRLGSLEGAQRP